MKTIIIAFLGKLLTPRTKNLMNSIHQVNQTLSAYKFILFYQKIQRLVLIQDQSQNYLIFSFLKSSELGTLVVL